MPAKRRFGWNLGIAASAFAVVVVLPLGLFSSGSSSSNLNVEQRQPTRAVAATSPDREPKAAAFPPLAGRKAGSSNSTARAPARPPPPLASYWNHRPPRGDWPTNCSKNFDGWQKRDSACKTAYRDAMIGMAADPGVDVVFGANDGVSFEPARLIGYWKRVPHHVRVLVEPVPPLFARLKQNTENLTRRMLINKAVKLAEQNSTLDLFCWDIDMVDDWVKNQRRHFPDEPTIQDPQEWWNALCSTRKEELFARSHVLNSDFHRLPLERQQQLMGEVHRFVVQHTVPAATPAEIVSQAGMSDIKYVQIDVEGMDIGIVNALPLGQRGFLPRVILYEACEEQAPPILVEHGYYTCCCVHVFGDNTVAILDTPAAA